MICVNTENDIKYRIVIGRRSRNAAYRALRKILCKKESKQIRK